MRLVIVGGGPAALAAARGYRDAGGDGEVTILTPELTVPYTRPALSKEFLRGETDDADLPIEPPAWYSDHAVDIRLGTEAETLDPADAHPHARGRRDAALRRVRARHRRRAGSARHPRRDRGVGADAAQPRHRARAARPGGAGEHARS